MSDKSNEEIKKMPIEKCLASFKKYILGNELIPSKKPFVNKNKEDLLSFGLKGDLSSIHMRPFAYKIFLNYLPIENNLQQWISITFNNRISYLHLKSKYFPSSINNKSLKKNSSTLILKTKIIKKINDININNKEKDEEMTNLIKLDLSRTFQEISLFNDQKILDMLYNILYIYCKEHSNSISYKQGMNEIIGILFLSIYPYYFPAKKNISKIDIINAINAYNSGTKLVLYKTEANNNKKKNIRKYILQPANNKSGLDVLFNFFHDENYLEVDLYYLFNELMEKGFKSFYKDETFQLRCDNIIKNKLKIVDLELCQHCLDINLPYQIFFGKWLQCFFDRETSVNNCINILDICISQEFLSNDISNNIYYIKKNDLVEFEFLDCICISMIEKYKNELMTKKEEDFLVFCLCYPEIQNINEIIQLSNQINIILKNNKIEITKINDQFDNKICLKITPKKKMYFGKSLRNDPKSNSLYFSESSTNFYKNKKISKNNTVINNNDNKIMTCKTHIFTISNDNIPNDKTNKSTKLIDPKKNNLKNKIKKEDESKNSSISKFASLSHQFDDFIFNDLIDAYYF